MTKTTTHRKGLVGELEVALYLTKNGWNVFSPLDPNSRIDLIIEKDGEMKKIQVKYLTPYKGVLRIDLEKRNRNTEYFTKTQLDAVVVLDSKNQKFYLVPFDRLTQKNGLWLRVENSKNNQEKGVNWASEYEI